MAVDTTAKQHTLTPAQAAAVERARQTPYTVSRTYRRPPGDHHWTHAPVVALARDIDIVALIKEDRQRALDGTLSGVST